MILYVIIILDVAVRIGGVRHFCLSARECSCGLIRYIATGVPAFSLWICSFQALSDKQKNPKRFHSYETLTRLYHKKGAKGVKKAPSPI